MKQVELLAPAGNYEALEGAICAGADAVYLAGNRFGARAYADNFTEEELRIFNLLSQGRSITEIAMRLSVCDRTVNRKINKIKKKISKLEEYDD